MSEKTLKNFGNYGFNSQGYLHNKIKYPKFLRIDEHVKVVEFLRKICGISDVNIKEIYKNKQIKHLALEAFDAISKGASELSDEENPVACVDSVDFIVDDRYEKGPLGLTYLFCVSQQAKLVPISAISQLFSKMKKILKQDFNIEFSEGNRFYPDYLSISRKHKTPGGLNAQDIDEFVNIMEHHGLLYEPEIQNVYNKLREMNGYQPKEYSKLNLNFKGTYGYPGIRQVISARVMLMVPNDDVTEAGVKAGNIPWMDITETGMTLYFTSIKYSHAFFDKMKYGFPSQLEAKDETCEKILPNGFKKTYHAHITFTSHKSALSFIYYYCKTELSQVKKIYGGLSETNNEVKEFIAELEKIQNEKRVKLESEYKNSADDENNNNNAASPSKQTETSEIPKEVETKKETAANRFMNREELQSDFFKGSQNENENNTNNQSADKENNNNNQENLEKDGQRPRPPSPPFK